MLDLVRHVNEAFAQDANPQRAEAMSAYMRHQFSFYGLSAPLRKDRSRAILKASGLDDQNGLDLSLGELWALPQRELQYFGVDLVVAHTQLWEPATLDTVRRAISEKPWWDTVDLLASHAVGGLVRRFPVLQQEMDRWAASDDIWLARTALLHQLRYKERTDTDRLFGYCRQLAGHPEFFLRKAIGWALRQYSYTAPEAVEQFVKSCPNLSGLSQREALKVLLRAEKRR